MGEAAEETGAYDDLTPCVVSGCPHTFQQHSQAAPYPCLADVPVPVVRGQTAYFTDQRFRMDACECNGFTPPAPRERAPEVELEPRPSWDDETSIEVGKEAQPFPSSVPPSSVPPLEVVPEVLVEPSHAWIERAHAVKGRYVYCTACRERMRRRGATYAYDCMNMLCGAQQEELARPPAPPKPEFCTCGKRYRHPGRCPKPWPPKPKDCARCGLARHRGRCRRNAAATAPARFGPEFRARCMEIVNTIVAPGALADVDVVRAVLAGAGKPLSLEVILQRIDVIGDELWRAALALGLFCDALAGNVEFAIEGDELGYRSPTR